MVDSQGQDIPKDSPSDILALVSCLKAPTTFWNGTTSLGPSMQHMSIQGHNYALVVLNRNSGPIYVTKESYFLNFKDTTKTVNLSMGFSHCKYFS